MNYKEILTEAGYRFHSKCHVCGGTKEYWIKGDIKLTVRPFKKVWYYQNIKGTFDDFSQLP